MLRVEKMFSNLQAPFTLDKGGKFVKVIADWQLPDEKDELMEGSFLVSVESADVTTPHDVVVGSADLCLTSCEPGCERKGHHVIVLRNGVPIWNGRCVELNTASFISDAQDLSQAQKRRWISSTTEAAKISEKEPPVKVAKSDKGGK